MSVDRPELMFAPCVVHVVTNVRGVREWAEAVLNCRMTFSWAIEEVSKAVSDGEILIFAASSLIDSEAKRRLEIIDQGRSGGPWVLCTRPDLNNIGLIALARPMGFATLFGERMELKTAVLRAHRYSFFNMLGSRVLSRLKSTDPLTVEAVCRIVEQEPKAYRDALDGLDRGE